jgi:hypothetical protein
LSVLSCEQGTGQKSSIRNQQSEISNQLSLIYAYLRKFCGETALVTADC